MNENQLFRRWQKAKTRGIMTENADDCITKPWIEFSVQFFGRAEDEFVNHTDTIGFLIRADLFTIQISNIFPATWLRAYPNAIRAFHQFKLITPFHFNSPEFHQHPLHVIVLALHFLLCFSSSSTLMCVATNLPYEPDSFCCATLLLHCNVTLPASHFVNFC